MGGRPLRHPWRPARAIGAAWVAAGLLTLLPCGRAAAYSVDTDLIVRDDATPLRQDLVLGRFGNGNLFFDTPADVAVDQDDRLFILDAGNRRVQVADDRGFFLRRWPFPWEGKERRSDPAVLALDSARGTLFVLDRKARKIHRLDLEGKLLGTFGEEGLRPGFLDDPVDMAVDEYGDVFVLDRGKGRVLRYSPQGRFLGEFGRQGDREREFGDPVSLCYSRETIGYILVLDAGRPGLIHFDRDGIYRKRTSLPPDLGPSPLPTRVRPGRSGEFFVLEGREGKLLKLEHAAWSVFALPWGEPGTLNQAGGMVIDRQGRVYITDPGRHRIYRFPLELP